MNQLLLTQDATEELKLFPHIIELGILKNTSIKLDTFPKKTTAGIKCFFVSDGKFQWDVHTGQYTVYPGDAILLMPGQAFGHNSGTLEVGSFSWINIDAKQTGIDEFVLDKWTSLSEKEITSVSKILFLNSPVVITKFEDAGRILKCIQNEILNKEVGHYARVNSQIDELLILIARKITVQSNPGRDFPKTFMKLEAALRQDLSHQWTVEEMAALVGLGATLFNEKVKNYSGFTPLNYLINIRISEAIKLLKKKDESITDIALDTGFYSSQHFSTTFKKLTGYTPGEFRKNNAHHI
ncbi:MAG: AraC family transcriptional regulator [Ferruginibacter sp.]